jgi:hypothetical protein
MLSPYKVSAGVLSRLERFIQTLAKKVTVGAKFKSDFFTNVQIDLPNKHINNAHWYKHS